MKSKYILEVDYWSTATHQIDKEWFITSKPATKIKLLLDAMPPDDVNGWNCSIKGIKIHQGEYMEAGE